MTVKTILTEPNKILRQVSLPVEKVGNEERQLMDDMLETMYDAKGIGLAAIQIGVPKRIIVMDIGNREKEKEPMYFVNPIIKNKNSEHSTYEEGCLSVPGFYEKVDRFHEIEYEAQDLQGEIYKQKAEGLLAVCIQHEIDHLDGKLFVDYISNMKRDRIAKKIKKLTEQGKLETRNDVPYSI